MKTAVEWYNEEINKLNVGNDARVFIAKLFELAKEMEKQQIIDAFIGHDSDTEDNLEIAEQYYNETFK
jgi:hypothetical protein